jgi:hypothetical protein
MDAQSTMSTAMHNVNRQLQIVARYLAGAAQLEPWWAAADGPSRSGFSIEWGDAMARLDLLADADVAGRLDEAQAGQFSQIALAWNAAEAAIRRLGLDLPEPSSLTALADAARRSSLARGA